jgi:hypothetical protein
MLFLLPLFNKKLKALVGNGSGRGWTKSGFSAREPLFVLTRPNQNPNNEQINSFDPGKLSEIISTAEMAKLAGSEKHLLFKPLLYYLSIYILIERQGSNR